MLGNKNVKGEILLANGMIEEFEIALKYRLNIILLSETGYQTKVLADKQTSECYENVTVIDLKEPDIIVRNVIDLIKKSTN